MDEYEVDLRDYLRVLWQGKWIVLATFLVAVGVAAVVTFRTPDVYRAVVLLSVKDLSWYWEGMSMSLGAQDEVGIVPPLVSPQEVGEWAKDSAVWEGARAHAGDQLPSTGWLLSHLRVKVEEPFLEIVLEGPAPPAQLEAALSGLVAALQARGEDRVREAVTVATAALEARERALASRMSALEEDLAQVKSAAQAQREFILSQIAEREGAVPEELAVLYARLEALELHLDELERLGVYALPGGADLLLHLEEERLALEAEKERLRALNAAPPAPLESVRGPSASSSPVAPDRKMNLAVAGVLGLLVGILLAFFWHWLRGPGEVAAESGDGKSPRG